MAQQVINRKASGLFTHPNRLDLPPGALTRADNAVILRDGCVSKRRGFSHYGTGFVTAPQEIFEYLGRLIVYDSAPLLQLYYDSDSAGTFLAWTGTFNPPTGERMTALEVDKVFLFTTSLGVWGNDELTGVPVRSGIPAGLDQQIALTGIGGSWFSPDTQVGYRVIFGRTNANEQLLLGKPSWRETLVNPINAVTLTLAGVTVTVTQVGHGYTTGDIVEISDASDALYENGPHTITVTGADTYTYTVAGAPVTPGTANTGKKFNVSFTATIPSDIAAGDFYEVYRTAMSVGEDIDPGMRHFKVIRTEISSTDITNKFVTFTDDFDEALLGEDLYTNDTVETEGQGNDRPPYCKFMAYYEGHVFYANILDEHELQLQLNSTVGLVNNSSSITFSDSVGAYVFDAAENIATRHFQRFTAEPTEAQNIEKTMKSFCKVMNRTTNTVNYAFYVSGIDDAPGKVVVRHRALNGSSFSVIASSAPTGDNFQPVIPTAGTTIHSVNNARTNIIRNSKFQRSQAVPKANERRAGPEGFEILGMVTIPEGVLIFTEDGLYVISGQTDGTGGFTFTLERKDPTVMLITPYALVALDNTAHGFTTQGVLRCNQASSSVVSRAVEQDLQRIAQASNFRNLASGIAYESDREFLLLTPRTEDGTNNEIIWVYNYFTNAWTRWIVPATAGHVLSTDDKLYLLPVDPTAGSVAALNAVWQIYQERKSYLLSGDDFSDFGFSATITAHSTTVNAEGETVTTFTLALAVGNIDDPLVGADIAYDAFSSAERLHAKIVSASVAGLVAEVVLDRLATDLDPFPPISATVTIGIDMQVEWTEDAGSAGTLKHWCFFQVYPEQNKALNNEVSFFADIQRYPVVIPVEVAGGGEGWGSMPWGSSPWGDRRLAGCTPIRVPVDLNHARSRILRAGFRNRFYREFIDINQVSFDVRLVGARTERGPQ